MSEKRAAKFVKVTSTLVGAVSNYSALKVKNELLKDLEHEGDQFTHNLFRIIDKTFVTPLNKEDISELTSTIDQVLDATYDTSDWLVLFNIQQPSRYMKKLANLLYTAYKEINKAVKELRLKQQNLMDYCTRISNFEHEGDKVYRNTIAELFETHDAVEIKKLKEVYETLESALERSRDVADVIEDIALKFR